MSIKLKQPTMCWRPWGLFFFKSGDAVEWSCFFLIQ